MTVGPVAGIERRQVHLGDGVYHQPRQMVGRQPLPHIRGNKNPCSRHFSMKFCDMLAFQ
jgi:hypothetical protein